MTCWGFGFKSYDLNQGTPKFFGGGPHKLLHNIPRAGYFMTTYVIVSGYVTFYQINAYFVNILLWQNVFAGRIWPAGCSLDTLDPN